MDQKQRFAAEGELRYLTLGRARMHQAWADAVEASGFSFRVMLLRRSFRHLVVQLRVQVLEMVQGDVASARTVMSHPDAAKVCRGIRRTDAYLKLREQMQQNRNRYRSRITIFKYPQKTRLKQGSLKM